MEVNVNIVNTERLCLISQYEEPQTSQHQPINPDDQLQSTSSQRLVYKDIYMKLFHGMKCLDCSGPDSFPLLGWAELWCCQEDTECRVQTQLSTLTEDQERSERCISR